MRQSERSTFVLNYLTSLTKGKTDWHTEVEERSSDYSYINKFAD